MFISADAIAAFVLAAELGSFSAAARRLGKRQSTISETIANLEIELAEAEMPGMGRAIVGPGAAEDVGDLERGAHRFNREVPCLPSRQRSGRAMLPPPMLWCRNCALAS